MLMTAGAAVCLGLIVGLSRPVGAIWPLLAACSVLVPIISLLAGGSTLSAFAGAAACIVAIQFGYVIGLLIRGWSRTGRNRIQTTTNDAAVKPKRHNVDELT
jgi:hypothetical protein